MFKHIILVTIIALAMTVPCQAAIQGHNIDGRPTGDWGKNGGAKDISTLWMRAAEPMILSGSGLGLGKMWFVNSNVSSAGDGQSWTAAVATLDEIFALINTDRNSVVRMDIIDVAEAHNEPLTTADGVDADIANVVIRGHGYGSAKPTFDYDDPAGEFVIGAANIKLINLRFRVSSNAVTKAIDVESAGDNYQIIDCDFGWAETATDEFNNALIIGDTANEGLVQGCIFKAGGQAAVSAIKMDADIVGIIIRNNIIYGDYSTACIVGDEASDDIIITGNLLFNGTMGGDGEINAVAALSVANSTAGFVADNRIVSAVASGVLARVADDMVFINNFITGVDGDEFSGVTENNSATITANSID